MSTLEDPHYFKWCENVYWWCVLFNLSILFSYSTTDGSKSKLSIPLNAFDPFQTFSIKIICKHVSLHMHDRHETGLIFITVGQCSKPVGHMRRNNLARAVIIDLQVMPSIKNYRFWFKRIVVYLTNFLGCNILQAFQEIRVHFDADRSGRWMSFERNRFDGRMKFIRRVEMSWTWEMDNMALFFQTGYLNGLWYVKNAYVHGYDHFKRTVYQVSWI